MKILSAVLLFSLFSLSFLEIGHAKAKDEKAKQAESRMQKATFAAGCFWGVEDFFRKVPGVVNAKVGYTGGDQKNPKYEDVSEGRTGHAESVEIEFDSTKVSYEKLLDLFFKMHDPTTKDRQGNDKGSQYRSAIFYNNQDQKKAAESFIVKVETSKAWKAPIVTQVVQAGPFYLAEEEHQKYLIKNPGGYDNHHLRSISFDK